VADLIELVRAAETSYPMRVAARAGTECLSFAEVADRSDRAAAMLRGRHGSGDGVVALLVGNRIEGVELDVGLIKAGLGRVSINPRLAGDEIRYVIGDAESRVLVYDPIYLDVVEALRDDYPDLGFVRLRGRPGPGTAYEDDLAAAGRLLDRPVITDGSPSLLMYTSGTTGRPKGATWTFGTRRQSVANMLLNELDADGSRVMMHVGSLSHGSGSKVVPVYLRGGCNLIMESFDAEEFVDAADANHATATFVVPTMIKMIVDATAGRAGSSLASMRHVAYGGAKMPLPTIEAALDRFGEIFCQVYGSCEAPHPMLLLGRYDHASRDPRILSSAGRPAIGVDLRIGTVDGTAEPGAQGEILLRGPSVMAGYWGDEAATAEVMESGYYRTGDVGLVHEDGVVEIVDRIKNMIISGGFNVYPAEVERVLTSHPGVAQACVYGLRDDHWGEVVAAAVVTTRADLTEDALAEHCARSLAGYKKPRTFLFADEFPLGPTGKVLTAELRRRHADQRQQV